MTTYSKLKGNPPFNWFEFLARAKRGELTSIDQHEADKLSGSWKTCACGNLCASLPRNSIDDSPKDIELRQLGSEFTTCVSRCEWTDAEQILIAIEKRACEVLATMEMAV